MEESQMLEKPVKNPQHAKHGITFRGNYKLFLLLAFKNLGVIYGDIGTSPLYVVNTVFTAPPEPGDLIGGISLVIWSLLIMVTFKYVVFILQADAEGEGGTFAFYSLLLGDDKKKGQASTKYAFVVSIVTIVGTPLLSFCKRASMVIADGALTPAISVISAIEGLQTFDKSLAPWVVPITIVILVALFMYQRNGTSRVGSTFSPIMVIWFLCLAIIGIYRIAIRPDILACFNPGAGIMFLAKNGFSGSLNILGGVFLSITGLEALYADLGHFGANPIRLSWSSYVLPALCLNYIGQGALLLEDPTLVTNPFFYSVGSSLFWPLFVLATLATVIASQAMISGCFSLIHQAVALNLCPPFPVLHTSTILYGQIYVPIMNYFLMILTCLIIIGFGTSSNIANAYGVTVCTQMIMTTVLYSCVMVLRWKVALWKVAIFAIFFLPIDFFFWISNLSKIPQGGYVTVIVAACYSAFLITWTYGEKLLSNYNKSQQDNVHYEVVLEEIKKGQLTRVKQESITLGANDHPVITTKDDLEMQSSKPKFVLSTYPGYSIFYCYVPHKIPQSFVKLTRSLHTVAECPVFLTIETEKIPYVDQKERIELTKDGNSIHLSLKFGYAEHVKLLETLKKVALLEGIDEGNTTLLLEDYYVKADPRNHLPHRWVVQAYSLLKRTFRVKLSLEGTDELVLYVGIRCLL